MFSFANRISIFQTAFFIPLIDYPTNLQNFNQIVGHFQNVRQFKNELNYSFEQTANC